MPWSPLQRFKPGRRPAGPGPGPSPSDSLSFSETHRYQSYSMCARGGASPGRPGRPGRPPRGLGLGLSSKIKEKRNFTPPKLGRHPGASSGTPRLCSHLSARTWTCAIDVRGNAEKG